MLLDMPAQDVLERVVTIAFPNLSKDEKTVRVAMIAKLWELGVVNGDLKALLSLFELAGEMPDKTQKLELSGQLRHILTQEQQDAAMRAWMARGQ